MKIPPCLCPECNEPGFEIDEITWNKETNGITRLPNPLHHSFCKNYHKFHLLSMPCFTENIDDSYVVTSYIYQWIKD